MSIFQRIKEFFEPQPPGLEGLMYFQVNYVVGGRLQHEYRWRCLAESKKLTEDQFWTCHNPAYCNILQIIELQRI